jgi:hypothetical protein
MLDGWEVSISPNETRDRLTPDRNDDRFRAMEMGCRLPNQLNFHTSWNSTYRLTEPDALDTVLDIILSKGIGGQCRWRALILLTFLNEGGSSATFGNFRLCTKLEGVASETIRLAQFNLPCFALLYSLYTCIKPRHLER